VLDLWLMVVLCDYAIEICMVMFPLADRYTLRWYASKIFGLISSSLVLFVLLYEITTSLRAGWSTRSWPSVASVKLA
jgi:hypothetical protein